MKPSQIFYGISALYNGSTIDTNWMNLDYSTSHRNRWTSSGWLALPVHHDCGIDLSPLGLICFYIILQCHHLIIIREGNGIEWRWQWFSLSQQQKSHDWQIWIPQDRVPAQIHGSDQPSTYWANGAGSPCIAPRGLSTTNKPIQAFLRRSVYGCNWCWLAVPKACSYATIR